MCSIDGKQLTTTRYYLKSVFQVHYWWAAESAMCRVFIAQLQHCARLFTRWSSALQMKTSFSRSIRTCDTKWPACIESTCKVTGRWSVQNAIEATYRSAEWMQTATSRTVSKSEWHSRPRSESAAPFLVRTGRLPLRLLLHCRPRLRRRHLRRVVNGDRIGFIASSSWKRREKWKATDAYRLSPWLHRWIDFSSSNCQTKSTCSPFETACPPYSGTMSKQGPRSNVSESNWTSEKEHIQFIRCDGLPWTLCFLWFEFESFSRHPIVACPARPLFLETRATIEAKKRSGRLQFNLKSR